MAALASLSVASNVFQVISFADTVFRAGKDLYELLDKARTASKDIASLLLDLQALLKVVASVRKVIIDHASSPFAQDDGQAFPNVDIVLTLIEQDFRHMRNLLERTLGSSRESWFSLLSLNVRWALKDQDIVASRQRIARYTQNLTVALSVSGRQNDIAIRKKLQSLENTIQVCFQTKLSPPRLEINGFPESSRRIFQVPGRKLRAICAPKQSRNDPKTELVRKSSSIDDCKNRSMRLRVADINGEEIPLVGYPSPIIDIYEQENKSLLLDTGKHELRQITKSVVVLRDPIVAFIDDKHSNRAVGISATQAEYLQTIVDFLVASAHTTSAEAMTGMYKKDSRTQVFQWSSEAIGSKSAKFPAQRIAALDTEKITQPEFIQKHNVTLVTAFGTVKAELLSGRSSANVTTLAFACNYLGNVKLGLSPFTFRFSSNWLSNHLSRSLYHYLRLIFFLRYHISIKSGEDPDKTPGSSEIIFEKLWRGPNDVSTTWTHNYRLVSKSNSLIDIWSELGTLLTDEYSYANSHRVVELDLEDSPQTLVYSRMYFGKQKRRE